MQPTPPILQWFRFAHLPEALHPASRPFAEIADQVAQGQAEPAAYEALLERLVALTHDGEEQATARRKVLEAQALEAAGDPSACLRLLLEAKDAAVRARLLFMECYG